MKPVATTLDGTDSVFDAIDHALISLRDGKLTALDLLEIRERLKECYGKVLTDARRWELAISYMTAANRASIEKMAPDCLPHDEPKWMTREELDAWMNQAADVAALKPK